VSRPVDLYEDTPYFEKGKKVFTDLSSPFQRYRIKKISEIYEPSLDETVLDLGRLVDL
jgi:hypothetical protein